MKPVSGRPVVAHSAWSCRARWSLALLLLLSGAGCDRDAADATVVARPPDLLLDPPIGHTAGPPVRIVPAASHLPDPAPFTVAKSVALVAHELMPYVAQARYCWPSFRVEAGYERNRQQRVADEVLRQADLVLPPHCMPEPRVIERDIVQRQTVNPQLPAFNPITADPKTRMDYFLGQLGLGSFAAESCNASPEDRKGRLLRRRWRSGVRIQRTGNAAADGAFATVIADPRFRAAMGGIDVTLVTERPNVLNVASLEDVCLGGGRSSCNSGSNHPAACPNDPYAMARERLARQASGGRTGYFPDANTFESNRFIGRGLDGFTVGDDREITGAVCINLTGPGFHEKVQGNALMCLMRALGIAGTRSAISLIDGKRGAQSDTLVDSDAADRASLSDNAFRILRSIYGQERS